MARRRLGGQREILATVAFLLGALMVVFGLYTLLTPMPHPEIATAGGTLILATGLIGSGNGKKE